ncbi:Reverse transcriptase domain [Trinorchestia longiramus]|nr:Reverse transcriptase domain [Trinorchestia longiramus]
MASRLEKTYVKWLKHYLTGRTASMRLGAGQSEGVPITWGLPQGAVLSPLLFNIMLSDLPVADGVQLIIYADDITILSKGDSLTEVRACLERYLDNLAAWFKEWKLIVNPAKCSQQIFTKKHSIPDVILQLNNSVVRNVTCQRVLEIVFDAPRLTFAAHIGNLVGDFGKESEQEPSPVPPWSNFQNFVSVDARCRTAYHGQEAANEAIIQDDLNAKYSGFSQIFTDGSKLSSGSTAATLFVPSLAQAVGWKLNAYHTVLRAELFGIHQALTFANKHPALHNKDIVILSDSQSALHLLKNIWNPNYRHIVYDI